MIRKSRHCNSFRERRLQSLKESLGNVIKEIDDISESGQMVVDGRHYKVEFFLGGDYKVCELKT